MDAYSGYSSASWETALRGKGRQAEGVGVVHPGEEKTPVEPYSMFQYVTVASKKYRDKPFSRICSDMTWGNGFKIRECRFRLDTGEFLQ